MNNDIQSMDWEKQIQVLEDYLLDTNFENLSIVGIDGKGHYADGSDVDLSDRGHFKKALEGLSNVSNDLITSRATGNHVFTYAVPIEDNGKVVGVLMGHRNAEVISGIAETRGYGEKGYGYIINSSGTTVGHADRERAIKQDNPIENAKTDPSQEPIANLFKGILEMKNGISEYEYNGAKQYAGFSEIGGSEWIFIVVANRDETLMGTKALQALLFYSSIAGLFIAIVITFIIGKQIADPIILVAEHGEKLAALNFTENVPANILNRNDEIGLLGQGFQSITVNLKQALLEVGNASESIASTSEELSATTEETAASAMEVSKTSEEIAKGAMDQAHNTEVGSTKAIGLGNIIEEDLLAMEELSMATGNVNKVVEEGLTEIEDLYEQIQISAKASQDILGIVMETNESAKKIGDASNIISSIAEQTNLLALNAAIEAARAGDAGRGFAVVAEEIRKLAEESTSSTVSINQVVKELQDNSQSAVRTMGEVGEIVNVQTEKAVSSRDKYIQITRAMSEAKEKVNILNESSKKMGQMKDDILNTLENLSAIAEENSAATEEVTASMEEQSAAVEEIAHASESLAHLAEDLQNIIVRFKI